MRCHPRLIAAVTGLATVAALTGCSVNFPGGSSAAPSASSAASPSAKSSSPAAAASHQKPLTAVPTDCPSADAIALSVKVSLPSVDSNTDGDTLECTYYDPSVPATALVLTFGPSQGATPAEFDQQVLAANPNAVAVAGVGDAALYFTHEDANPPIGNMNFLSGAVFGYVYGNLSFATQEHLTALIADQILVP